MRQARFSSQSITIPGPLARPSTGSHPANQPSLCARVDKQAAWTAQESAHWPTLYACHQQKHEQLQQHPFPKVDPHASSLSGRFPLKMPATLSDAPLQVEHDDAAAATAGKPQVFRNICLTSLGSFFSGKIELKRGPLDMLHHPSQSWRTSESRRYKTRGMSGGNS